MDKINVEMETITRAEIDDQKLVYDSSVDHKGRVPLRSSTGVWKASLFIIGKHLYNNQIASLICLVFVVYLLEDEDIIDSTFC